MAIESYINRGGGGELGFTILYFAFLLLEKGKTLEEGMFSLWSNIFSFKNRRHSVKGRNQGQVVQSIISLMSLLRGQLVNVL